MIPHYTGKQLPKEKNKKENKSLIYVYNPKYRSQYQ